MRSGLLPDARHLVLPVGIVANGFPAVAKTCSSIGIEFDPWQQDLNRCILAKDGSGDYAADTVVISICRQAGKTYDVGGVIFADSIINPGTLTVWTAHRFPVARESFDAMRVLAESPLLAPHIDASEITTGAGNETIPFRNGSRIAFKARERGAIRGFAKVRRLVLDEGQILTTTAMADMAPTMNQAWNPQVIIMGTPPKPTDPSEVFVEMRREALEGTSAGTVYVEFGADPDCDPDDEAAWAQANPSFPLRTSRKAIIRLKKLLKDPADFRREGLGIWDSDSPSSLIASKTWRGLAVAMESSRPSPIALAVEVAPDRSWSSIGLVGQRADGRRHVQIVTSDRGTAWVADRLGDLVETWKPKATLVRPGGPAGSLLADLSAAGIDVTPVSDREAAQACGAMLDAVNDGVLAHSEQPLLDVSVRSVGKQAYGKQLFVWRSIDAIDIAPWWAVTLAHWGLVKAGSKPKTGKASFH